MTPVQRLAGLVMLILLALAAGFVGAWQIQDWRYGIRLERQARLQADALNNQALTSADQRRAEEGKRLALEQRLQTQDQTHHKELTDEQKKQARLRDRLATADLRLSVVLAAADTTSSCTMSTTTATGCVVHGTTRAQLDPAHAQRIIGVTDAGDRGLIALRACQAYAKEVSTPK